LNLLIQYFCVNQQIYNISTMCFFNKLRSLNQAKFQASIIIYIRINARYTRPWFFKEVEWHMKIFLILIAALLASCASQNVTNLKYGSEFTIALPSHYMNDSTIFYSDELGLKTSTGKVIAGQTVSHEKDQLPDNFDMRLYPEYLLKLRPISGLSQDIAEKFENTSSEIDDSYGLKSLEIKKEQGRTVYSVCKADACLAFVVISDFKDHIFYAHTMKIPREEFINLLPGGSNVKL